MECVGEAQLMNLQEAAEKLDITKKKLWRAVKAGNIEAIRKQVGNRWEYRVTEKALEDYRLGYLVSRELDAVKTEQPGTTGNEEPLVINSFSELQERLAASEQRARELEEAFTRTVRYRAKAEREREALADRLSDAEAEAEKARIEAKVATMYLKEARTLIQGWDDRRKQGSFWRRLVAK